MKLYRDDDGTLPAYAWPGGYPLYYMATDDGILCPACANAYTPDRDNEEQLKPIVCDVNWEDTALTCENCDKLIESAYGEVNEHD